MIPISPLRSELFPVASVNAPAGIQKREEKNKI